MTFGIVRLGVWGRKNRLPMGNMPLVEMDEKILAVLEIYADSIRVRASELKALYAHVVQEARTMRLEFMEGIAVDAIRQVSKHDRLMRIMVQETPDLEARTEPRGSEYGFGGWSIFPVEDRWALNWEEIVEDPETAKRIEENPKHWILPRHDDAIAGGLLDYFKKVALEADVN